MNEPTGRPGLTAGPPHPALPRDPSSENLSDDLSPASANESGRRPNREQRFLVMVLGCAAVLSLMIGVGLVAAWRGESIVVQVSEHGSGGDNIHIRVPAAAGHLALLCLPDCAFAGSFRDRVFRHGEMRTLVRELERIPDGTMLVQVDSPREAVRISRERGLLLIHVDSDEENVRIEVPIKLAGAILKRVEHLAQTS